MNVLYFTLLIGVLIFVHETGHFVFAKIFGVRVLTFSLGFGPRIVNFRHKETDYAICCVPLGGYVKMLGESPGEEIPTEDRHRSFAARPLWQRTVIVLAGPTFNMLLPLVLFFAIFVAQRTELPAELGKVYSGLPAARAGLHPGDRVVAVNGTPVRSWDQLRHAISARAGAKVDLTIERANRRVQIWVTPEQRTGRNELGMAERAGFIGVSPNADLPQIGVSDPSAPAARAGLETWDVITAVNGAAVKRAWDLENRLVRAPGRSIRISYVRPAPDSTPAALGQLPARHTVIHRPEHGAGGLAGLGLYSADLFVAHVTAKTPGAQIGLKRGDRVVRVDGRPVTAWETLLLALARHPNGEHHIVWAPFGGGKRTARFKLAPVTQTGAFKHEEEQHVFGAESSMLSQSPAPVPVQHPLARGVRRSVQTTGMLIEMTALTVVRLLEGAVPRETIGGPLMIYYTAGEAARMGWSAFISMMALISVNLGIFNLLPIPVLDGGHLLLFAIEGLRGRRLSLRTIRVATSVGLVLVLSLLVFAFRNDVARYWMK